MIMAEMKIKLPTFVCLRCGHRWHPAKPRKPLNCAFCKSPAWQTKGKSAQRRRHDQKCVVCV